MLTSVTKIPEAAVERFCLKSGTEQAARYRTLYKYGLVDTSNFQLYLAEEFSRSTKYTADVKLELFWFLVVGQSQLYFSCHFSY